MRWSRTVRLGFVGILLPGVFSCAQGCSGEKQDKKAYAKPIAGLDVKYLDPEVSDVLLALDTHIWRFRFSDKNRARTDRIVELFAVRPNAARATLAMVPLSQFGATTDVTITLTHTGPTLYAASKIRVTLVVSDGVTKDNQGLSYDNKFIFKDYAILGYSTKGTWSGSDLGLIGANFTKQTINAENAIAAESCLGLSLAVGKNGE
jgi:hypothetical protein